MACCWALSSPCANHSQRHSQGQRQRQQDRRPFHGCLPSFEVNHASIALFLRLSDQTAPPPFDPTTDPLEP